MEDFIDVAHLVSLDEDLSRLISQHFGSDDESFDTGLFTRKPCDSRKPG
jgi:hypothetical protein